MEFAIGIPGFISVIGAMFSNITRLEQTPDQTQRFEDERKKNAHRALNTNSRDISTNTSFGLNAGSKQEGLRGVGIHESAAIKGTYARQLFQQQNPDATPQELDAVEALVKYSVTAEEGQERNRSSQDEKDPFALQQNTAKNAQDLAAMQALGIQQREAIERTIQSQQFQEMLQQPLAQQNKTNLAFTVLHPSTSQNLSGYNFQTESVISLDSMRQEIASTRSSMV